MKLNNRRKYGRFILFSRKSCRPRIHGKEENTLQAVHSCQHKNSRLLFSVRKKKGLAVVLFPVLFEFFSVNMAYKNYRKNPELRFGDFWGPSVGKRRQQDFPTVTLLFNNPPRSAADNCGGCAVRTSRLSRREAPRREAPRGRAL